MAKELPYFQFEPAEYLTKDISFCSLSAQGLFINICSFYWQRQCKLTKEQFLRRFNYPNEFDELLNEGVIDVLDNYIIIKFLDLQYNNATKKSQTNSQNGSKGGRPKKQNETEIKPNKNQNETELKGIREDEIKEDNKKVSKPSLETRSLAFKNSLIPFKQKYSIEMLKNFYGYWTEPNKSNTKMRFELEKTWSIERRLETWSKRENDFKPKQQIKQDRL